MIYKIYPIAHSAATKDYPSSLNKLQILNKNSLNAFEVFLILGILFLLENQSRLTTTELYLQKGETSPFL